MTVKFFTKKLLQSLFGLENYLRMFQLYLFYASSSSFLKKFPYYKNKFKDLDCLTHLIHEGDICIDVGANLGIYTYKMAEIVGESGKVYSFEPMSINYKILLSGINVKYHDVIIPERKIISNLSGEMTMVMPKQNGVILQGLSHIANNNSDRIGLLEKVPCLTLDDYFASFQRKVNWIKCDVEGHEFEVLSGAKTILIKHRPAILCEIWNTKNLPLTFNFIESLGYSAYLISPRGLKKVEKDTPNWERGTDYFFFPNEIKIERV